MSKQLKINFTDKEMDIYHHISKKTSKASYIKDLIRVDMEREQNYINGNYGEVKPLASPIIESKPEQSQGFDFDIDDLDL
ncbi:hypothetical protein [Intestinibacter sp.]